MSDTSNQKSSNGNNNNVSSVIGTFAEPLTSSTDSSSQNKEKSASLSNLQPVLQPVQSSAYELNSKAPLSGVSSSDYKPPNYISSSQSSTSHNNSNNNNNIARPPSYSSSLSHGLHSNASSLSQANAGSRSHFPHGNSAAHSASNQPPVPARSKLPAWEEEEEDENGEDDKFAPLRYRPFPYCRNIKNFSEMKAIGSGIYGEVFLAKDNDTGIVHAIKKVMMKQEMEGFPITSIREIKLLRKMKHENIINMSEIVYAKPTKHNRFKGTVFLVFERMDHDLEGLIKSGVRFTYPQIKCYAKQLFSGLHFLHSSKIAHRDLKPANILVNNKGILKICDFGLARELIDNVLQAGAREKEGFTNRVVTVWYRPPELLFGSKHYSFNIDVWSAGCILAEMYKMKPIFNGCTELEVTTKILDLCGSPSRETFEEVYKSELYPEYKSFESYDRKRRLREYFNSQKLPQEAVELLDRILVLNPKARISTHEILDHSYFWTAPLPAKPESLPHYPSSFELQFRHIEYLAAKTQGGSSTSAMSATSTSVSKTPAGPVSIASSSQRMPSTGANPSFGRPSSHSQQLHHQSQQSSSTANTGRLSYQQYQQQQQQQQQQPQQQHHNHHHAPPHQYHHSSYPNSSVNTNTNISHNSRSHHSLNNASHTDRTPSVPLHATTLHQSHHNFNDSRSERKDYRSNLLPTSSTNAHLPSSQQQQQQQHQYQQHSSYHGSYHHSQQHPYQQQQQHQQYSSSTSSVSNPRQTHSAPLLPRPMGSTSSTSYPNSNPPYNANNSATNIPAGNRGSGTSGNYRAAQPQKRLHESADSDTSNAMQRGSQTQLQPQSSELPPPPPPPAPSSLPTPTMTTAAGVAVSSQQPQQPSSLHVPQPSHYNTSGEGSLINGAVSTDLKRVKTDSELTSELVRMNVPPPPLSISLKEGHVETSESGTPPSASSNVSLSDHLVPNLNS